jgi:ribonuclease BN (tRNA processing enzyme)
MRSDQLRLAVLGSASPYPSVDNPCPGYLMSTRDSRLWLAEDTGTFAALRRRTRSDELTASWITHPHAGHGLRELFREHGARRPGLRAAVVTAAASSGQDKALDFGPDRILDGVRLFVTCPRQSS